MSGITALIMHCSLRFVAYNFSQTQSQNVGHYIIAMGWLFAQSLCNYNIWSILNPYSIPPADDIGGFMQLEITVWSYFLLSHNKV